MGKSFIDPIFKDPIAAKPPKKMKSPWTFTAPPYDERSSCFIEAGDNYGVGHKSPVGHLGQPKDKVDTLPSGRPSTMPVGYVYNGPNTYQIDISE